MRAHKLFPRCQKWACKLHDQKPEHQNSSYNVRTKIFSAQVLLSQMCDRRSSMLTNERMIDPSREQVQILKCTLKHFKEFQARVEINSQEKSTL